MKPLEVKPITRVLYIALIGIAFLILLPDLFALILKYFGEFDLVYYYESSKTIFAIINIFFVTIIILFRNKRFVLISTIVLIVLLNLIFLQSFIAISKEGIYKNGVSFTNNEFIPMNEIKKVVFSVEQKEKLNQIPSASRRNPSKKVLKPLLTIYLKNDDVIELNNISYYKLKNVKEMFIKMRKFPIIIEPINEEYQELYYALNDEEQEAMSVLFEIAENFPTKKIRYNDFNNSNE